MPSRPPGAPAATMRTVPAKLRMAVRNERPSISASLVWKRKSGPRRQVQHLDDRLSGAQTIVALGFAVMLRVNQRQRFLSARRGNDHHAVVISKNDVARAYGNVADRN